MFYKISKVGLVGNSYVLKILDENLNDIYSQTINESGKIHLLEFLNV